MIEIAVIDTMDEEIDGELMKTAQPSEARE
jgi:hypothetical protein